MKRSAPERAPSALPRRRNARQELGFGFHTAAALEFIAAARCNASPAPRAAGSVPGAGNSAGIVRPRCAGFHLPAGLRLRALKGKARESPVPRGNGLARSGCAQFVFAKHPEILARKGPVE